MTVKNSKYTRGVKITWSELGEILKGKGLLMEDDKTKERIAQITLVKPRALLIHTKEQ